jgi:hypothetical protein
MSKEPDGPSAEELLDKETLKEMGYEGDKKEMTPEAMRTVVDLIMQAAKEKGLEASKLMPPGLGNGLIYTWLTDMFNLGLLDTSVLLKPAVKDDIKTLI